MRDIVRRTELASGTFYNYFPDKEAVFRAVVEAAGAEARRRVRAARRGRARPARSFVEAGYRAYFAFIVEDPATFAFLRRNLGALGAAGLERELPLGAAELAEDLARADRARRARRARPRLLRARDGRRRGRARRAHGRARAARRRGRDALRHRARRSRGDGAPERACRRHARLAAAQRAVLARARLLEHRDLRAAAARARSTRSLAAARRVAPRPHGLRRLGPLGRRRARELRAARRAWATGDVAIGGAASPFAGLVAAALPAGARVLAVEGDFTSVLFPFLAQEARGVRGRAGAVRAARRRRIGPEHDLVAFSVVQSADGRVADLDGDRRGRRARTTCARSPTRRRRRAGSRSTCSRVDFSAMRRVQVAAEPRAGRRSSPSGPSSATGSSRTRPAGTRARTCPPPTTARRCGSRTTPAASTSRRRG